MARSENLIAEVAMEPWVYETFMKMPGGSFKMNETMEGILTDYALQLRRLDKKTPELLEGEKTYTVDMHLTVTEVVKKE